jgi:hypothetical protein
VERLSIRMSITSAHRGDRCRLAGFTPEVHSVSTPWFIRGALQFGPERAFPLLDMPTTTTTRLMQEVKYVPSVETRLSRQRNGRSSYWATSKEAREHVECTLRA